jgi:hypothetical protein
MPYEIDEATDGNSMRWWVIWLENGLTYPAWGTTSGKAYSWACLHYAGLWSKDVRRITLGEGQPA